MYECLASSTTIRLLDVQPGTATDPLTCGLKHCDLRHRDLNTAPEYEAISYVWGNATSSCSVICDSTVIPVTQSLQQALLRIRLSDRIRTVWIDGLCINQTDDVEKSNQVQLMQRIFRDAKRVLVWLGPDGHNAAYDAFEICRSLEKQQMDCKELQETITAAMHMNAVSQNWNSLLRLVECHWWKRVWIIQEAVLAQNLLFFWGAEEIQWLYIDHTVANLQKLDSANCTPFTAWTFEPISRLSAIKDQRCYATSFMGTMHTARAFKCTDSRDRIYGVLGLASDDDRWASDPDGRSLADAIIPDYTESTEGVYRKFAILSLQQNLVEDILLAVQHGDMGIGRHAILDATLGRSALQRLSVSPCPPGVMQV
jgi:hypothetical protein